MINTDRLNESSRLCDGIARTDSWADIRATNTQREPRKDYFGGFDKAGPRGGFAMDVLCTEKVTGAEVNSV